MDVAIVQWRFANGFAGAALEQNIVGQNDGARPLILEVHGAADVL